jgi:hypothetical protein
MVAFLVYVKDTLLADIIGVLTKQKAAYNNSFWSTDPQYVWLVSPYDGIAIITDHKHPLSTCIN